MNTLFKTFQQFATKLKNHSMPCCNYVKVENGMAIFTNLEDWVIFSADGLSDGYYSLLMNEPFFSHVIDPETDTFPDMPILENTGEQIVINAGLIVEYSAFIANDELRPIMNSIYIDNKQIVASDAHVLRCQNHEAEATEKFKILLQPTMPVMARLKADNNQPLTIRHAKSVPHEEKPNEMCYDYLKIEFSDCVIYQQMTEGKYPDYKSVIPNWRNETLKCFTFPCLQVKEFEKVAKSFKAITARVFTDILRISNVDLALSKMFPSVQCELPNWEPAGLIMPMQAYKVLSDAPDDFEFAFSPLLLPRFAQHKGNVIIGCYDNTRALAVWIEKDISSKPAVQFTKTKATVPVKVKVAKVEVEETKQLPEYIPTPPTQHTQPTPPPMPDVRIIEYSDRAIAVFGNTRHLHQQFMDIYGVWNRNLTIDGQKTEGWVFSKKRKFQVEQLIAS